MLTQLVQQFFVHPDFMASRVFNRGCSKLNTYFSYLTCLMCISVLFTGDTKPSIAPAGPYVVVLLNAPFELQCLGEKTMQWQREERPKVRGEKKVDGKSTLYIPKAHPAHMGRYICLEEASQERASIYVYVKGTGRSRAGFGGCLHVSVGEKRSEI